MKLANSRRANEDGTALDDEISGLDVAEQTGGGSKEHGAGGLKIGGQFAGDFRPADGKQILPAEMIARRNNQTARDEGALDARRRMDFERALGHELAEETPFNDGLACQRIGIEEVTFFLQHQPAIGPEIL